MGLEEPEGSKGGAFRYSRRGLRLRRRGAYSPVLTHGLRVVSPLGKRLTMICASLALLHPLLSLTHWIFRSLMLPYKSSSHSANHVRCASLRSGGRRLAVRKTIEYQIGALPRTPFPAAREFPSRGNERYEEKNRGVICFMYYSGNPPLVAGATTSPPQAVGLWVLSHGAMSLQESIETYSVSRMGWQGNTIRKGAKRPENRVTCFPVEKVRRSRIRGAAQRLITRMLTMPYDTESKSRNADFISIALRAIRHLQRRRRCRPLSGSDATLLHNPRDEVPSTLTPKACPTPFYGQ